MESMGRKKPRPRGRNHSGAKACAKHVFACGYRIAQGVEPAGHLPTLKVGCQKLRGQKRIEMKY